MPRRTLIAFVLLAASTAQAIDDYKLGPDSSPRPGVPHGTIEKFTWQSKIFPGTTRDYWVYVPAQYKASEPACVMVFQDGGGYQNPTGAWRVPVVFDNLIAAREMPVTLGVFVNPGVVPPPRPNALARFNRSYEYDGLGDQYARFLIEELLPEVGKKWKLSPDPECRAIAGASSGAIAAFNAAWERPDAFRRVFSTIGTYVGLRGGDQIATLVRQTEPKPLRVFLQDGANDLNIYGGNWFLANQQMASALEWAGYEVKHEWGDGGHTGKHGAALLPDALRWLWRDFGKKPITVGVGSKAPIMEVLIPGEDWKPVGKDESSPKTFKFTEGPAVNTRGEVFFSDIPASKIYSISLDDKVRTFVEQSGGANGLMFGPDGNLYAAQNGRKRVVAYDAGGKEQVVAEGLESNDLAVGSNGNIYVTDPNNHQVWLIPRDGAKFGAKRVVDTGIGFPNGVRLTPDQSLLYVADMKGRFVYSFQIQKDGTLAHKQPYCHLHVPDDKTDSGADGMTVDSMGRLYVATHMGVQFCDQAGRVNGIIAKPQRKWLANIVLGGAAFDELYATASDRVYRRKVKAKGVLTALPPITPPAPRL